VKNFMITSAKVYFFLNTAKFTGGSVEKLKDLLILGSHLSRPEKSLTG
jgi:hypothetical protein